MLTQQSVLGCCLLSGKAVQAVLSGTSVEMFDESLRPVYQAVSRLFLEGKRVDPVTVAGQGIDRRLLMELMDITPSAAEVKTYVTQLRDLYRLNQAQELGSTLASAQSTEQAQEVLAQLTTLMQSAQSTRVSTFAQLMADFPEAHQKRPDYLRWGMPMLDEMLTVQPGSFVILGGYPSAGKTALALQFLLHQSAPPSGKRIGIFSYETDAGKLRDRSVSHAAGYDLGDILSQPTEQLDAERLYPALRELSARAVTVIQANGLNVAQIYSLSLAHRFDVVYIDYLQLIRRNPKLFGQEQVAEISWQLQGFAHSTGITVIALSQFSRQERPQNTPQKSRKVRLGDEEILLPPRLIPVREPTMADLRESGQLEQDADAILLLWRPYPDSEDITHRVLKIAKNKDGKAGGKLTLRFDGDVQRFTPERRESLMERIKAAAKGYKAPPPPQEEEPQQMELTELTGEDEELPF